MLVARYTAAGALDASFADGGVADALLPAGTGRANAVAVDRRGRILVAGQAGDEMAVARLAAGGGLDPAFGTAGVTLLDPGAGVDAARAIALDGAGRIVVPARRARPPSRCA